MRLRLYALSALVVVPVAAACGGGAVTHSSSGAGGGTGGTGGASVTVTTSSTATTSSSSSSSSSGGLDGGAVSTTYPAFPPDVPQVETAGGVVLASPTLVPVFFAGEDATIQASLTDFLAKVGATTYWADVTAEYGVGPAVSATPVVLTETAPATIDDSAIQTWLTGKLDGNDPAWPAADANTLYVLHYPAGTTVTLDGNTSCTDFGGYHNSAALDAAHGAVPAVYAVVPRCADFGGLKGINAVTGAESHELVEACTDPTPREPPLVQGYVQPDEAHLYWYYVVGGGEVGDMCAQFPDVFTRFPELAYEVQRTWSNASAAAGHDPCVPELPGEVYATAMPVMTDDLSFNFDGATVPMRGVKIPMGQSKTIDIDLSSEGDTGGPFTVEVKDWSQLLTGQPALTFSLDNDSGQNGEILHLTLTPVKAGTFSDPMVLWPFDAEAFVVIAHNGSQQTWQIGLVGN